jgi:hypothetical protein
MADFRYWKHENLIAFCEAANARLKEMQKQIATERQLAYEWGFSDGVDSCRQVSTGKRSASTNQDTSSCDAGNV